MVIKQTTKWITATLVLAVFIYLLSPGPHHLLQNPTRWEFREQFVYLTGVSAMLLMVLSVIISIRLPWLNRRLHGLDKGYIIHKWTGIFASILAVFHWLGEDAPKWLVELGVIPNPGELNDGAGFSDLEIALFQSGTAIIEYIFYLVIILVIIALIKKIPYRVFRKTHKIFPGVFLIAAYHGATAPLKERWFETPAAYLLLLIIGIGVVAALIALFQMIGAGRKTIATVTKINYHNHGIIEVQLISDKPFVYAPGQYAFLRFQHDGEPHPFTIAGSGNDPHILCFVIKNLGDFTASLKPELNIGHVVEVEGPYGEFKFDCQGERQLWIAGGIGITPFLARLENLSREKSRKHIIDFWYCTRGELAHQFPASLEALCKEVGVNLHHLNSSRKEYLTADVIYKESESLMNVSIWFCGPVDFRQCLLRDLKKFDFDKNLFHYDDFNMR